MSTLISTCGLIIGLATLFDTTTSLERFSDDILQRKYPFLNSLKLAYVFAALFIVIVIIFNLVIGFIATDQSIYRSVDSDEHRRGSGCCEVSCLKSSTAVCLLKIFLAFNYIIYYVLLLVTIMSFIGLYTVCIATVLCKDSPNINRSTGDDRVLDLRQFAPVINLNANETELLLFQGLRFKRLCSDYVSKLSIHLILCTAGFLLACAGFVNYLINFSVNAAKLSTKQKLGELVYFGSEMSPVYAKYESR